MWRRALSLLSVIHLGETSSQRHQWTDEGFETHKEVCQRMLRPLNTQPRSFNEHSCTEHIFYFHCSDFSRPPCAPLFIWRSVGLQGIAAPRGPPSGFKALKHGKQFGLYSGSERNSGSIENTWGKYGMINSLSVNDSLCCCSGISREGEHEILRLLLNSVSGCSTVFLCFRCQIFIFLSKNRRLFNNFNISNLPIIVSINQLIIESKKKMS